MTNNYDAIIIGGGERAGLKPPAQCMEAVWTSSTHRLWAGTRTECSESASADFHELRQDFSPTDKRKNYGK